MTASAFTDLNQTFVESAQEIEVNEKLCFNTALLDACRMSSPPIEKYLRKKGGGVYGKLAHSKLQLIPIDSIHGLEPITNQKTGKVKPRGFQVRADEDLDGVVVDELEYCMNAGAGGTPECEWDASANQMVLFLLGSEWRYTDNLGRTKLYGIANANHRYTAALRAGQTHVIAWVIDIPLKNLKKWVTAEANRQALSCKPRSDADIIDSVLTDLNSKESDLYSKIQNVSNAEYNDILIEEVKEYNVSSQKVRSIVRDVLHQSDLKEERKQWTSTQMTTWFDGEWKGKGFREIKHDHYNFASKDNKTFVIVVQDEGRGVQVVVDKYISHILGDNKNCNLIVAFSTAKAAKIDKNNRESIRESFKRKVNARLWEYYQGTKLIFKDLSAIVPRYIAYPEFDDENKFIFID